jgi:mycothiol synthase
MSGAHAFTLAAPCGEANEASKERDMHWQIKAFEAEDYPALGHLLENVFPDYPGFLEETRHEDEHRPAHCKAARWIAWDGKQAMGSVEYRQQPTMYHPRRFIVELMVHAAYEGCGLGGHLYDHLLAEIAVHKPIGFRCFARDDMPRGVAFAEKRGFVPFQRDVESHLDLEEYDPLQAEEWRRKLAERNIVIKSLPELEADPDRDPKLYGLRTEILRDVPAPQAATAEGFDVWQDRYYSNPALIRDAVAIALDGDRYVGYSNLYDADGEPVLYTGLTGTLRDYRGRGIAQALKHKNLAWAKAAGREKVMTWNELRNADILAINEKVGFRRKAAWINYAKEIKGNGETS